MAKNWFSGFKQGSMYQCIPYNACFLLQSHKKTTIFQVVFVGADTQIRTGDLILTKDALYRLSYISENRSTKDIIAYFAKKSKW